MKAKKTVSQQSTEKVGGYRGAHTLLRIPKDDREDPWTSIDFDYLVEFIKAPNLENAQIATSMAFARIQGLNGLELRAGCSLKNEHWDSILGSIELNASIIRRAFELVHDYASCWPCDVERRKKSA